MRTKSEKTLQIEACLREGGRTVEVSKRFGISHTYVSLIRRRAGIPPSPRPPRPPRKPRKQPPSAWRQRLDLRRQAIQAYLRAGRHSQEIADLVGTSISEVSRERRRLGIGKAPRRTTRPPNLTTRPMIRHADGQREPIYGPAMPLYRTRRADIVARLARNPLDDNACIARELGVYVSYVEQARRYMASPRYQPSKPKKVRERVPRKSPSVRKRMDREHAPQGSPPGWIAQRAAIIEAILHGYENRDIAFEFKISPQSVSRIRGWLRDGLIDEDGIKRYR
jgi:hypothetical protein